VTCAIDGGISKTLKKPDQLIIHRHLLNQVCEIAHKKRKPMYLYTPHGQGVVRRLSYRRTFRNPSHNGFRRSGRY
jgi:hypothetical protein